MYRALTFAALATLVGCRTPALLPPVVDSQHLAPYTVLTNTMPDAAQNHSDQNTADNSTGDTGNDTPGITGLPGNDAGFRVIEPPTKLREDWDKWTKYDDPLPVSDGDKATMVVLLDPDRRWTPIYFAYNQNMIGHTERRKLELLGQYLLENNRYQLVIEGHCDNRGSDTYNRALGESRAIIVRDYLVALGVNNSRMHTLSYGEDKPADTGTSERAYANNRRAEFVVLSPQN